MYLNYLSIFKQRRMFNVDSGNGNGGDGGSGNKVESKKTVDKDLFDKTASELAQLKKDYNSLLSDKKALEDKGKTEEQLNNEKLAELEKKLKDKVLEVNKANSKSILSEIKAKINLDTKVADIDEILDTIVSEDETINNNNAMLFNKLFKAIYEKGLNDASDNNFKKASDDIKNGGNKKDEFTFKQKTIPNGRVEL